MNYTEEQYSELYNNLPKGLRDLVLTGALTTQVGAIAMKYGLTPEETSELEPAIEDVALGLVTPEELRENIFIQVGLDQDKSQAIASEVMRDIYGDFLEELRLTRKYKIELDTRIRGENQPKEESVEIAGDKSPVAGNIISITKDEPMQVAPNRTVSSSSADQKVTDWFSGRTAQARSSRDELDSLGEEIQRQIPIKATPKPQPMQVQKAPEPEIVAPTINTKPKTAWEELNSQKANILKPISTPTPSPSREVVVNPSTANSHDFDKSMVQVEQQILTLTQAVNKMIDQNTKTINPVVQSVFNSGQYEEISKRLDAMNHRMDDLQSKFLSLSDRHQKDVVQATASVEKIKEVVGVEEEDKVNNTSAIDRIIQIKKETSKAEPSKSQVFTSSVSRTTLDGIAQPKKEEVSTVGNPINIIKAPVVDTAAPIVTTVSVPQTQSRTSARDQLMKDIEELKKNLKPSVATAQTAPAQVEIPKEENILENKTSLQEEINPSSSSDTMKSLQEKIKSLNKGITQGGIVSAGSITSNDPYKI
jgi:hypothetical protein